MDEQKFEYYMNTSNKTIDGVTPNSLIELVKDKNDKLINEYGFFYDENGVLREPLNEFMKTGYYKPETFETNAYEQEPYLFTKISKEEVDQIINCSKLIADIHNR